MKKLIPILCIFLLAVSVLCACGKKKEQETPTTQNAATEKQTEAPTQKPTETTTEPAQTKEALDPNSLIDIVFNDLHLSVAFAADVNASPMDADGNVTVSFKLNNIDCYYLLNGYTGAIISRNVPPEALMQPEDAMGPFEAAVNTAMGSIDGYSGGATNIQTSLNDNIITVDFDWNGNHYTFHYDTNQGILVD